MKLLPFLFPAAALVVAAVGQDIASLRAPIAPNPGIIAATDAETAWKPIAQSTNPAYLQGLLADLKAPERPPVILEHYRTLISDGVAFIQRFPHDPRRWDVILRLAQVSEGVANPDGTLKPPFTSPEGVTWDAAAWAAWLPQIKALKAQIAGASDASAAARFAVEIEAPGGLREISRSIGMALQKKEPVDVAPFRAELLRLAAKYPEVPMLGIHVGNYLMMRAQSASEAEMKAELQELATHANVQVRAAAQKALDKRTRLEQPLEIAFTAVDGRRVDLKDYLGKVVLVDFWATWCGPCIAELPTIRKVYAEYHDQGFEVIGISLEKAGLRPNDTPEQTAAKLAAARKVLMDFTAKEDMPWPQYFDGKHWKNDLSTRYQIDGIPAMFLIDQTGKLVSTNARGEKLETEVKRLLKR